MKKKEQQTTAVEFFTAKNTVRTMNDKVDAPEGNAGMIAILSSSYVKTFTKEYQNPEYQLFRLGCGFGVQPDAMGNACFGYFCADGERCRMERYNFIGIADEATTKYAEELEAKWQKAPKAV